MAAPALISTLAYNRKYEKAETQNENRRASFQFFIVNCSSSVGNFASTVGDGLKGRGDEPRGAKGRMNLDTSRCNNGHQFVPLTSHLSSILGNIYNSVITLLNYHYSINLLMGHDSLALAVGFNFFSIKLLNKMGQVHKFQHLFTSDNMPLYPTKETKV